MFRVLALTSVLATTSCGTNMFACSQDEDCASGDRAGSCAAGGACAFPDGDCPSGQRYGEHAGAMSSECVPPLDTTSGDDDTGTSAGMPTTVDATTLDVSVAAEATTVPADTSTSEDATTGSATADSGSTSESSTGGASVDPDLLIWLRFDALDDEGVVNDGVLGGHAACSTACPSVAGGGASFDGGSCLAVPHQAPLDSAMWTVAFWVRTDQDTATYNLASKAYGEEAENSWELFVLDDMVNGDSARIEVAPAFTVSGAPPQIGVWMHLAATYDGALTLYSNGQPVGQIDVASIPFDEHAVRFGCDTDNGADGYFFTGMLSDARVYDRALDEVAIAALAADLPPDP